MKTIEIECTNNNMTKTVDVLQENDKYMKVAIEGTQNIINLMHKNATIIFPSTHVVFEGIKERKENLDESEKTSTFLAYSTSKVENEEQIKKSGISKFKAVFSRQSWNFQKNLDLFF